MPPPQDLAWLAVTDLQFTSKEMEFEPLTS